MYDKFTMKAKVQLYKSDGEREGKYPIKLILSHNKKVRRKTIGHAGLKFWNEDRQLPTPSHPNYDHLFDLLKEIEKNKDKQEFIDMENFDSAFEYLLGREAKTVDFLEYGAQRANIELQKGKAGNARAYRIALKELKKFKDPVFFKDITSDFLERFKEHKQLEGLKNTSLRAYLYAYKAIYREAVKKNLVVDVAPFEDVFKDIKVRKRRAKNVYLEPEHIKLLEESSFKQRNYNLAKDLVLLQFYLGGLDFVDVCYLKRNQIRKGRVILERAKLGEKKYEFDVLLPEKAKTIMDRWEGNDKDYVFDFPKSETGYRTFRVRMYRCLQQIKKQLKIELSPKDATFTLKVMRHTFATFGKFNRIEEDLLRELMGHERNDIDTVYKDKYPEKERDQAQLLIIG